MNDFVHSFRNEKLEVMSSQSLKSKTKKSGFKLTKFVSNQATIVANRSDQCEKKNHLILSLVLCGIKARTYSSIKNCQN